MPCCLLPLFSIPHPSPVFLQDWKRVLNPGRARPDPIETALLARASEQERSAVVRASQQARVNAAVDLAAYEAALPEDAVAREAEIGDVSGVEEQEDDPPTQPWHGVTMLDPPSEGSSSLDMGGGNRHSTTEEGTEDGNNAIDRLGSTALVGSDGEDSETDVGASDFTFEFDQHGARIRREEQLEDAGVSADAPTNAVMSEAGGERPTKASRKSRTVRIKTKAPGQEGVDDGETRVVTLSQKSPGIFKATNYFWLFYEVYPATGVSIVPVGQLAREGEAHAILDATENIDADAVQHSNSTYEFAGVDPLKPGLLYAKTLPCFCTICRNPVSIGLLSPLGRCPFWQWTGRWRQHTVQALLNVPEQQQKQRATTTVFVLQMKQQPPQSTYAVFADPRKLERGGHPYLLVESCRHPFKAPKGTKDAWGQTIRVDTWIAEVYWFM